MTKILAYYSLATTAFCIIMCLFFNDGDENAFIGGIIFIPVLYSLWEMTNELKITETRNKQKEKIRNEELLRQKIREEIENDNEKV